MEEETVLFSVCSGINITALLSHFLIIYGNARSSLMWLLLLKGSLSVCTGLFCALAANIFRYLYLCLLYPTSNNLIQMQELLTNTKTLEKQAIIFLKDVSFSNLKALVDYMYKVCSFYCVCSSLLIVALSNRERSGLMKTNSSHFWALPNLWESEAWLATRGQMNLRLQKRGEETAQLKRATKLVTLLGNHLMR